MAYDALSLGAFFGVLIAVGLYHVLMFALLRDRELLAYAVYVAALLAEEVVRTGFAANFLLTGTTPPVVSAITFAFLAVASFWFFTSFLQMRERAPRSYRAIGILTGVVVALNLTLGPFGGAGVAMLIQLLSLLTLFAVFLVALDQIRRGDRTARYFIIAFCGVLFGAALFVLGKIFWPQTILVKIGFELGTAFEAIALALGLADRIRLANEERDIAQRRILEETRSLNVAYARFVPREFLELLGKDDVREVRLGEAVQREMTVLFSDIRSFTTISEKMTPRENFDFLNGYLERVGPIVRQHRGVIDKYIGDAIMGLFAGPAQDADDALRCAIGLQREVAAIDVERSAAGLPRIAVGVGLHTGSLMLGTIGESERMDGTVIADAVNLASRVEGLTKNYGVAVLLTEQTRERLRDPSRYMLRHLGRVAVKGKAYGVGLYEACDADAPRTLEAKRMTLVAFEQAVEALGTGRFEQAHSTFGRILEAHPADGAAAYLQGRCESLARAGEPWDGVDHLTTK
ncbi:MAG: adenylate/guanylate cyclase domain-containing protein [Vulcanimicrobiaceae bacterium]